MDQQEEKATPKTQKIAKNSEQILRYTDDIPVFRDTCRLYIIHKCLRAQESIEGFGRQVFLQTLIRAVNFD